MTHSTLRKLLDLGLLLVALAALLFAFGALGAIVSGKPMQLDMAIVTDRPVERTVLSSNSAEVGTLTLSRGAIHTRIGGAAYVLRLAHAALMLAVTFAVIWLVRKVLIAIASGRPFEPETIRRLRFLGALQIGAFLWILLEEGIHEALVLPSLALPDGAALRSSISRSVQGVENIQVDFTINFGWLVGGLAALAIAEAFRIGANFQSDSEAVV